MKAVMLLAEYATVADGKLFISGGGWSIRQPEAPMAIAAKIEVPWSEANTRHTFRLALEDADGQPVSVGTPIGDRPVEILSEFEVGRPAGLDQGVPLDLPLAFFFGTMPLPPGRYCWKLLIDGQGSDDWTAGFNVVAPSVSSPG